MEQDSKMEATSALPECEVEVGSPTVKEYDENDAEPSPEDDVSGEEAVCSAMEEDNEIEEPSAEQVDDRKEAEAPTAQEIMNTQDAGNSAEKCSNVELCEEKNSEVLKESPAGRILKTIDAPELEDVRKEEEVPAAPEVIESPKAGKSAEKCSKSESSIKKNHKVLKVKQKIAKNSPACGPLKSNEAKGALKVRARRREMGKKIVSQKNGENSEKKIEDAEKLNQKETFENSVLNEEHIEKSEETSGQKKISELNNSHREQNNEEKGGSSEKRKNQKEIENDNVDKVQKKGKNRKKPGGLIFMCSAKTRPDCFRYRVMGVSAGKKDLVLAIRPGLKLFLYDFDLKLLYGIFKASSSGGMKLESKAFRGAFPAQVRFKVYKDCVPLPESTFKKAIKENYYAKNKFKAELTVKQVRKLSRLFRPIGFHSSAAAVRSPPRAPIRARDVHRGVKDVRSRDRKSNGTARNFRMLAREKDREVLYRDEAPRRRRESSHDLYFREKEYRNYGLRMERRNLDPVPRPALETYHREYNRDYHRRHPEPRYRETVPAQREPAHANPVYLGKDYPAYPVDPRSELSPPRAIYASGSERSAYEPYRTREYAPPSTDSYLLPLRRQEGTPPTYSARTYAVDTLPMRHAADALSYYNHRDHKKLDTEMPVSSRYSFAGPSYLHR